MISSDYHIHTDFSSDSKARAEDFIETAITKGFTRICFTDHMDYDFPKTSELTFVFDPDKYFNRMIELRDHYKNKIKILIGIEIGLKPNLGERYHGLIHAYDFDFVIGSTHLVNNLDPYLKNFWENNPEKKCLEEYFSAIAHNINSVSDFDVLGHIDYAIRYAPSKNQNYTYQKYSEFIDRILSLVIQKKKGIEINTSGYRYGLNHPHPQEDIIKRYRELGGSTITIGSDAHRPEDMAFGFERVKKMLVQLGFQYYTVFEKRKATLLPLV